MIVCNCLVYVLFCSVLTQGRIGDTGHKGYTGPPGPSGLEVKIYIYRLELQNSELLYITVHAQYAAKFYTTNTHDLHDEKR